VLVNVSRDDWRRRKVRTRFERESDLSGTVRSGESAAVAHAEVWHALNQLSPRQRAVIVLKELEDRPIPSIAALLGIGQVTVRWHLLAGRRRLAKALGLKETS
jgi:RNA polymerase sigma factor (sigma-70 family)